MDFTNKEDIGIKSLHGKLRYFGCELFYCSNGHKVNKIIDSIDYIINGQCSLKPNVLIVDTIKGYSLLCMENIPKFHFRIPTEEELQQGNRYETK